MPRSVHTHFLPNLFEPQTLQSGVAVVIDVLRASTTICHALHAGAKAVIPCETVEDARRCASDIADQNPLLGGERHGQLIEGFDLDNSPLGYTPEVVAGRPIVFTTTNGTRALARCAKAERILIGAFVNQSASVRELCELKEDVHLVCAGTNGEITAEDVLLAGAIARAMHETDPDAERNDQSRIAAELHDSITSRRAIHAALRESRGGRNLQQLNLDADIERAADVDRFEIVPRFCPQTGAITAVTSIVENER